MFQLCFTAFYIFLVNCTFLINFRSQDILNTQSFAKAVSRNGVLFVGLVSNSGVGCVNEHQVLQKENFVSIFLIFLFLTLFNTFLISHFSLSLVLNVTFRTRTKHSLLDLAEMRVT